MQQEKKNYFLKSNYNFPLFSMEEPDRQDEDKEIDISSKFEGKNTEMRNAIDVKEAIFLGGNL